LVGAKRREAEKRGCLSLDGLGMLVNQGVIGIRHWTGIEPDPQVMRGYRKNNCQSELDRDGITLFEKKPQEDG